MAAAAEAISRQGGRRPLAWRRDEGAPRHSPLSHLCSVGCEYYHYHYHCHCHCHCHCHYHDYDYDSSYDYDYLALMAAVAAAAAAFFSYIFMSHSHWYQAGSLAGIAEHWQGCLRDACEVCRRWRCGRIRGRDGGVASRLDSHD